MPSLGGWEIVILVAILLLLFGAKKLPDMARSVGQSARVFKGEMKGLKEDDGKAPPADAPAEPSTPQHLPQAQAVPQTPVTPQPQAQAQERPAGETARPDRTDVS